MHLIRNKHFSPPQVSADLIECRSPLLVPPKGPWFLYSSVCAVPYLYSFGDSHVRPYCQPGWQVKGNNHTSKIPVVWLIRYGRIPNITFPAATLKPSLSPLSIACEIDQPYPGIKVLSVHISLSADLKQKCHANTRLAVCPDYQSNTSALLSDKWIRYL